MFNARQVYKNNDNNNKKIFFTSNDLYTRSRREMVKLQFVFIILENIQSI